MADTTGPVNDVKQDPELLHDEEGAVFADAGYQDAMKNPEATGVQWDAAMCPCKGRVLEMKRKIHRLVNEVERLRASEREKVEHALQVTMLLYSSTKVRYRVHEKNTVQLKTLFSLSNLWVLRRSMMR